MIDDRNDAGMVGLTRRLSVNRVELAWGEWGSSSDGVPLVLCHGFSGSAHDFALNIAALAADRRVIALDHRGHGLSTKTGVPATYSFDQLLADFVAFVDEVVDGPFDLLGHSMGGHLALRFTADHPSVVRSLIAMDTSGWSFRPIDDDIAQLYRTFFESFDPAAGLPDLSAMPNPENALIEAATPLEWQQRKATLSAGFDPYAMKSLGHDLQSDAVGLLRPRLARIACPATVLVGSNDHPFVDQSAELAAELGDGSLTVIDGAYHSPQLTHAAEWHEAVVAHLARV